MKIDFKKITEELIPVFDKAGLESINLYKKGLKIEIKEDGSPVSNGDLKVNDLITKKIKELTPDIPIISEETVNIKEKNKNSIFWLIDPIDGTKEYISGKDEYTLNAALVIDKKPITDKTLSVLNRKTEVIIAILLLVWKTNERRKNQLLHDFFF